MKKRGKFIHSYPNNSCKRFFAVLTMSYKFAIKFDMKFTILKCRAGKIYFSFILNIPV